MCVIVGTASLNHLREKLLMWLNTLILQREKLRPRAVRQLTSCPMVTEERKDGTEQGATLLTPFPHREAKTLDRQLQD